MTPSLERLERLERRRGPRVVAPGGVGCHDAARGEHSDHRGDDLVALAALRAHVTGSTALPAAPGGGWATRLRRVGRRAPDRPAGTGGAPERPFSLEAIAPSGMDDRAWDVDRAVRLWGCGRPETSSTLVDEQSDRLVHEVATAHAPPDAALRVLSAAHPLVAVHAVTTCEGEYAWTAWFVRGTAVGEREVGLELTDEELEEWDGTWDLPADWAFDAALARQLLTGDGPT